MFEIIIAIAGIIAALIASAIAYIVGEVVPAIVNTRKFNRERAAAAILKAEHDAWIAAREREAAYIRFFEILYTWQEITGREWQEVYDGRRPNVCADTYAYDVLSDYEDNYSTELLNAAREEAYNCARIYDVSPCTRMINGEYEEEAFPDFITVYDSHAVIMRMNTVSNCCHWQRRDIGSAKWETVSNKFELCLYSYECKSGIYRGIVVNSNGEQVSSWEICVDVCCTGIDTDGDTGADMDGDIFPAPDMFAAENLF